MVGKLFIEITNNIEMKIKILYLVHSITALFIFALRIFYSLSNKNVFDNIYNFFNYMMPEIKSVIYFFLIMSMFANAFLNKNNKINQIIILLLIISNLFIIALSIKLW